MIACPVLARLLTTVAESWSAAMVEFAERYEADHDLLAHNFAGGAPLGQPVAAALDLSDPHNGLRTVAAITFSSGLQLIYKPRSLAMDLAFADFLDALNATGQLLDLRAPRTRNAPATAGVSGSEDRARPMPPNGTRSAPARVLCSRSSSCSKASISTTRTSFSPAGIR